MFTKKSTRTSKKNYEPGSQIFFRFTSTGHFKSSFFKSDYASMVYYNKTQKYISCMCQILKKKTVFPNVVSEQILSEMNISVKNLWYAHDIHHLRGICSPALHVVLHLPCRCGNMSPRSLTSLLSLLVMVSP